VPISLKKKGVYTPAEPATDIIPLAPRAALDTGPRHDPLGYLPFYLSYEGGHGGLAPVKGSGISLFPNLQGTITSNASEREASRGTSESVVMFVHHSSGVAPCLHSPGRREGWRTQFAMRLHTLLEYRGILTEDAGPFPLLSYIMDRTGCGPDSVERVGPRSMSGFKKTTTRRTYI
jgi:hypothetical protein